MMQLAVLRRARASDERAVVDLLDAAGLDAGFAAPEFFVLEQGARIVATARLRPLAGGAYELASVAVAEDLRGEGLGSIVVREALSHAAGPVLALALAPGFFERHGFRRLAGVPRELEEKAEGICASTGFVPMAREPTPEALRERVQEYYGAIAETRAGSCCTPGSACCGPACHYSPEEVATIPEGAELGLGTGNPVREARLRPGETTLDLGSGAGVDVFLAARAVGPSGRAIGVDVTPAMVARARASAAAAGIGNAEFHEAPIERLPLPDASVDVVTSNCVVNLSTDKPRTLREAFRVLRPGGRFVVSDTLRREDGAPATSPTCDCVGGALSPDEWAAHLAEAGFADVSVERTGDEGRSGTIRARKPA